MTGAWGVVADVAMIYLAGYISLLAYREVRSLLKARKEDR